VGTTWRTLSVIGVACSMLVSCSSDSDGPAATQGAPTTTVGIATDVSNSTASTDATDSTTPPSSIDEAADQAVAEGALLQLSDFEPGWSEVASTDDASQASVKAAIAECVGSDQDSALKFGGAVAETGTITSPDGDQIVEEMVTFAPTVAAATERMAALAAPEFALCIQPIYEQWISDAMSDSGGTLEQVTIGTLNVTPVGDSTVAYRITVTAAKGGRTQDLFVDLVVIQVGRVLASPGFQSKNTPFSIDDTEKYIALAASRLPAP